LKDNGIQFVDNFVAHTKISVQNMNRCLGVAWVDDNVYVSGECDSHGNGRIDILDSNGQHISSISRIGCSRTVFHIHHRDNNIYYTDFNKVYCIKKDGSKVFTFSSPDVRAPSGINTDRQGNVYVLGLDSNNIAYTWPLTALGKYENLNKSGEVKLDICTLIHSIYITTT
jgi:DNA-binding beta-propeller fold protein YncE